ncbi:MAG: trypsin-like peptidase domain-containing protein, partial [Myxococcales bacterium]|nr:trypsin-like peptidase domain-containing protein [Myxococcales bacterium]
MHRHRARFLRRLPPLTIASALGLGTGALLSAGCSNDAEASADGQAAAEPAAPLSPDSYDPRQSLAPMIQKVGPAVVTVDARGRAPSPRWRSSDDDAPRGLGSGFVIDADGLVVTNHHVIDGATSLEVRLSDGRRFEATVVGSDPATDLALLRLPGAEDLPVVTLGDSKTLEVGDWVV